MKSKMQKFSSKKSGAKGKSGLPSKDQYRKLQEKRKKPKETDDAEIETLTSTLWPPLGEKKEVSMSALSF